MKPTNRKLRMYVAGMYLNYGFILWYIVLLTTGMLSNDLGNLMFSQTWIWILLGLPTIILYQVNMGICIKKDTFPQMLALIFGLVFYSPFYSRRVLKNSWLWTASHWKKMPLWSKGFESGIIIESKNFVFLPYGYQQ